MSYYDMHSSYPSPYPLSSQDTEFSQGRYAMIPPPWYDATSDAAHNQYDPFGAGYDVQSQLLGHSQQWNYSSSQQSDYSQQLGHFQPFNVSYDPFAFATSSNTSLASPGAPQVNYPSSDSYTTIAGSHHTTVPSAEPVSAVTLKHPVRARHTQGAEHVGPQRSAKSKRPQRLVKTPYELPRMRHRAALAEDPQPELKEKRKPNSFFRFQQDIRQALTDPKTFALPDKHSTICRIVGRLWHALPPQDHEYWRQLFIRDENPSPDVSIAYKFHNGVSPFEIVSVHAVTEALRILVRCAVDKVFDPHMNETRVKKKRVTCESMDDARMFVEMREAIWETWKEWAQAPDAGELPPIFAPQDAHRTRRSLREFGLATHHVPPPVLPPIAAPVLLPVVPPVPHPPVLALAMPSAPSGSSSRRARPSKEMSMSTGYSTPAAW